jgi:hypothetical protein
MNQQREAADVASVGGGGENGAAAARFHVHSTPQQSAAQGQKNAPAGSLPAYLDGDLIMIAGRHVAAVRGGALHRTFDAAREMFRGGLSFRVDVLRLAVEHGAARIEATERGSGQVWRIDLDAFKAHGGAYNDANYGRQWYCAFAWWATDAPEPEPQPEPTGPIQLDLFGLAVRR